MTKWKPRTVTTGKGKYKMSLYPRLYNSWYNMLQRCYDPKVQRKINTYIGCSTDVHWHNFQNFAKDVLSISPDFNERRDLQIDKDLKYYGNKVYSPGNCLVVNYKINTLFVSRDAARGDLPLGVCIHTNNYYAQVNNGNRKQSGKRFQLLNDAVNFYWHEKGKIVDIYMREYPELSAFLWNYFMMFKAEYRVS